MNRKQRRRASALQRKEVSETRQKWESRVVEAFVGMGWTENQVRSHMRHIKTLSPSVASAIHKIAPASYVRTIVQEVLNQAKSTK
jgi:Holliday junction resolvasome RuvABC DNA-binding subunit